MMTQNHIRAWSVGLRTAPVILKNEDCSLIVNVLLDDASTETFINADVAAKLSLKEKNRKGNCLCSKRPGRDF